MSIHYPKKTLVLHIEVPGIYADDLPTSATLVSGSDDPTPEDYLSVVTEEWMREDVGLTIVTIPGEKNLNEDFEVHYTGRIVGVELRDRSRVTDVPGWARTGGDNQAWPDSGLVDAVEQIIHARLSAGEGVRGAARSVLAALAAAGMEVPR